MPQHKLVKKCKEDPDLRAELDKLDLYFHSEPNKEERLATLEDLFIIVDEKASRIKRANGNYRQAGYWLEKCQPVKKPESLPLRW